MSKRSEQLDGAIQLAKREAEAWMNEESGNRGIMPSSRFWRALQAMFGVFRDGDMPAVYREIDYQVRSLAVHWNRFVEQQSVALDADSAPGREFFTQLQHLFVSHGGLKPSRYPDMPGIKHYVEVEKVGSPAQLAIIFDWKNDHGDPDVARVSAELSKGAGSEFWLKCPDPRNTRLEANMANWQQELDSLTESIDRKLTPDAKPAPESLAELVEQGVSLEQIAKMLDTDPEDIHQQCVEAGLPLPPLASVPTKMTDVEEPGALEGIAGDESEPLTPRDDENLVADFLALHPDARDSEVADALDLVRQRVTSIRRKLALTSDE